MGDISKATDEFSERFGYAVESSIIEDPQQTALVRFLRQPAALHWLELIAPNGPGSKLSKAIERGGGMHHFCYEVPKIEEAVEVLRTQGMLPLGSAKPAVAFSGRPIAWLMDGGKLLVELVEAGPGDFSLSSLKKAPADG